MANQYGSLDQVPPYEDAVAITTSDSTTYSPPLRAVYVGGAGDVAISPASGGSAVTFKAPPVGSIIPVRALKIMSTNTTATLLIGLR